MVIAFLPCRAGSERVPLKNTRLFAGQEGGLAAIKLRQLLSCDAVDRIIVSTNDPEVVRITERTSYGSRAEVLISERPEELAESSTTTDALILHLGKLLEGESPDATVLWTHVTSPFFHSGSYSRAIDHYFRGLSNGHDSLMTVSSVRTFLWSETGAVNFCRTHEKWPRTQLLSPCWAVTNAAFMASVSTYRTFSDRIGARPLLLETSLLESVDIDCPEDFISAEELWTAFGARCE